ncbi:hypothetical protein [Kineobactrum salinum]|uniref:Kinase n=1 Tax=Kineobactrum salinum TaxID=2708301 RepID=A0A6C0U385_9GAMM|nr:hypothetical protein [Kineobactrum salinum]QIB66303.1 hypothetical protein G3T16_13700 [Kineobactrum salinum]
MSDAAVGSWRQQFLHRHQLDTGYLASAQHWFDPLAEALVAHRNGASRPLLVGVNGCQGSGKTTFCDYLCTVLGAEHGLRTIALSLDDFYLPRTERRALAERVHPLLVTRGVPGTHEMPLLLATLDALLEPRGARPVAVPRFDKGADDRVPRPQWDRVTLPLDIVLLEGWCLGAEQQSEAQLATPCNALEQQEDPLGHWRHYVNQCLATDFPPLHARIDRWVMLQAPSFDCVYRWRREQEDKLIARRSGQAPARAMDASALARFIQHYERLTRHCLETLPGKMDDLLQLDQQRRIVARQQRPEPHGLRERLF